MLAIARVNEKTKLATRRALLDAAARAFAAHGYHDTNINSVSEAAGFAKGTVYNYFASKQELLNELLREACRLSAASAADTAESATTRMRLEAFVEGNVRWARSRNALALLFARELLAGDADTRALILDASAPCIEEVAAILRAGIARGEIADDAPCDRLALMFIMLSNMLLLQGAGSDWPTMRTLPKLAAGLFLDGLASAPSQGAPATRRSGMTRWQPAR